MVVVAVAVPPLPSLTVDRHLHRPLLLRGRPRSSADRRDSGACRTAPSSDRSPCRRQDPSRRPSPLPAVRLRPCTARTVPERSADGSPRAAAAAGPEAVVAAAERKRARPDGSRAAPASRRSRRCCSGRSSVPNASRSFIGKFQPMPPPMKKPLRCCHVMPAFAVVKLLIGELTGAIVSTVRMRGPVNVSVSEFGTCRSARRFREERCATDIRRPRPSGTRRSPNRRRRVRPRNSYPPNAVEVDAARGLLADDQVEREIRLSG